MTKKQDNTGINDKLMPKALSYEECTLDFFEEGSFPQGYAIVSISKESYGLLNLKSKVCEIFFGNICKLNSYYYLLDLKDGNKALLMFLEGKIFVSQSFKEVIKVFEYYVLVKDLSGERKIVGWKTRNYHIDEYFSTWIDDEKFNNTTMFLPNDRKEVLILREGLSVINVEFKRVLAYIHDIEINNKFRVVVFEDDSMGVIRIQDSEESLHFKNINYILNSRGNAYFKDYVQVTLDDNKKAVLRISDFKLSKGYNDIIYLSSEYALIKDGDISNVLRLSDFAEAKWPEDQKS